MDKLVSRIGRGGSGSNPVLATDPAGMQPSAATMMGEVGGGLGFKTLKTLRLCLPACLPVGLCAVPAGVCL